MGKIIAIYCHFLFQNSICTFLNYRSADVLFYNVMTSPAVVSNVSDNLSVSGELYILTSAGMINMFWIWFQHSCMENTLIINYCNLIIQCSLVFYGCQKFKPTSSKNCNWELLKEKEFVLNIIYCHLCGVLVYLMDYFNRVFMVLEDITIFLGKNCYVLNYFMIFTHFFVSSVPDVFIMKIYIYIFWMSHFVWMHVSSLVSPCNSFHEVEALIGIWPFCGQNSWWI